MAELETDWPYDADRDDPLTKLRIPVTCFNPGWIYTVAFDRVSDIGSNERPTDAEAAMIASYIEFYRTWWYNPTWQAKLLERPFDIDGGCNTVILHKYGADDWAYRRRSWEYGPLFVPAYDRTENWPLLRVLDRSITVLDEPHKEWEAWKAAHPEVFTETAPEVSG